MFSEVVKTSAWKCPDHWLCVNILTCEVRSYMCHITSSVTAMSCWCLWYTAVVYCCGVLLLCGLAAWERLVERSYCSLCLLNKTCYNWRASGISSFLLWITSCAWCILLALTGISWFSLVAYHSRWHTLAKRPVQSNIDSTSQGSIQPHISIIHTQISTTAYSQVFVHTAEWTGAM